MKTSILHVYFLTFLLIFSSLAGFNREGGAYPDQFRNRSYTDPNLYWNGGGDIINGGDAVIIDPNAGSGAGMTDDSDALYNSYLQNFGVTH